MNRKIIFTRFWLLCIACLAAACYWPDATIGLMPIAYFTGQAGCFCCPADCTGCESGTANGQLQIDLDSIANHGCTNCTLYNATWVVTRDTSFPNCTWTYDDSSIQVCGTNPPLPPGLRIIAYFTGTGPYVLNVEPLRLGGSFPFSYGASEIFRKSYSPASDCSAFSSESIPHIAHTGTGFGGVSPDCSGSPTCAVSSI